MALQETHLTNEHLEEIQTFHEHLFVINSCHPDNPSGAGGIALVFNKLLTKSQEVKHRVLIPGRAIVATVNWNRGDDLTILAVYAPTRKAANHQMWEQLVTTLLADDYDMALPDVLLGDFNFVEDALDRFPAHLTSMDAPDEFTRLKTVLQMTDGWRETFPDTVDWTWRNADRSAMSRIDRIYMTRRILLTSRGWSSEQSGLTVDDHSRVLVDVVNPNMPSIGRGRWAMQASLTADEEFMSAVVARGAAAHAEMTQSETAAALGPGRCPQAIWASFKSDVAILAKQRTKALAGARASALKTKLAERDELKAAVAQSQEGHARSAALSGLLEVERDIQTAKAAAHTNIFARRDARNWREAETMSKSWFSWAKSRRPRETMTALRRAAADPPSYATSSAEMAELARAYHDGVQLLDLAEPGPTTRAAMTTTLAHVRRRLTPAEAASVEAEVTEEDVAAAISSARPGSAAGLDGLTYELWKALVKRHSRGRPENGPSFDILDTLLRVFRHIEDNGLMAGSRFAEGWLCPLYKKGERSEIANYRPITLLNTDYKLYTKIVATRLATVAPKLIHESQAGFVRGRSITAHSKITTLMLSYAEVTGENGMVVALDQEKAYDKIVHEYLYEILARFGIPDRVTRTIRSLYAGAKTCVIINGVRSRPYVVTRGVRQGDPLSCLLFNLAIEPLAEMLRQSGLEGYRIPGLADKLIATLYADDTTVYLSERDSFGALGTILDQWCKAAGAKFNVKKTEVIPMGSEQFRADLIQSRRLNPADAPIPAGIRVARDGETTRILGTWPGNRVDPTATWSLVKDKILEKLGKWEKKHPTLYGRSILSHTVVGGLSQYMTAAQGMPPKVARSLDSITLDFVWGHVRQRPVNMATLRLDKKAGGIGLLHVAARNDAQYLTWLSEYLADPPGRPTWAYIADTILTSAIIADDGRRIPPEQRVNPFVQAWRPNLNKLPFVLRCMVTTARRYHLVMDAPHVPLRVRETMDVWSHPAMMGHHSWKGLGWTTRCLRVKHEARTVEDLEEIAELDESTHEDDSECECPNCAEDRRHGCMRPYVCREVATDILSSIAGKWNTCAGEEGTDRQLADLLEDTRATALADGEMLVFDEHGCAPRSRSDLLRVCVNSLAIEPRTAGEVLRGDPPEPKEQTGTGSAVQVVICTAVANDSEGEALASFAALFPDGEYERIAAACARQPGSHTDAMIIAMLKVADVVPPGTALHIVTTAKDFVRALTLDLPANVSRGWLDWRTHESGMRAVAAALRGRHGETSLTYLDKRRAKAWPEVAATKSLARAAAKGPTRLVPTPERYASCDVPGIGLPGLRQRAAHQAIRRAAELQQEPRWRTIENLATIRASLDQKYGILVTDEQIWTGLQSRTFSRTARNFMWKTIHGAHKVGQYFATMPDPWREKKDCPTCGTTESMEHILFHCTDSGQALVWPLALARIEEKASGIDIDFGLALGIGNMRIFNVDGQRDSEAERTVRVIVSEAIFLIWKLRCTRRIVHADENWQHCPDEVRGTWEKLIPAREGQAEALSRKKRGRRQKSPATGAGSGSPDLPASPSQSAGLASSPGVLVGPGTMARDGVG